ncbi:hypothetical protein BDF22DRAFT_739546 [Syncephalis plumigaleata]|nr:hypothetical protein BDF22DRAFT_739546 [Syncephalis plumigaleata]
MNCIKVVQPDGAIRCYSEHHLRGVLQFLGCKQSHVSDIAATILEKVHECTPSLSVEEEQVTVHDNECIRLEWHYPLPRFHQRLAWSVRNREQGICLLLGGTSGCGKSTLASLLASRLGITTVLSTDNIRNVLRSFISETENPVLWASSYHAGEITTDDQQDGSNNNGTNEERAINGYKSQTEAIYPQLRETVRRLLNRNESVIIEGVHLSVEAKHAERFATRAKYMTLEPRFNKYMKYFENIRMIQSHLCNEADHHLVPKVDNTNVDQSIAVIHSTMLNVLSRMMETCSNRLVDTTTNSTPMLHEEYTRMRDNSRNSKAMVLRMLRERPQHNTTIAAATKTVDSIVTIIEEKKDAFLEQSTSTRPSSSQAIESIDTDLSTTVHHEESDNDNATDVEMSSNGSGRVQELIHFLDEVDYGSLGS